MCVNNGIAGEWQWHTGHTASFALRKWTAICVFITEVQAADGTVGANEGSAERHEVIQGLTFMCQNARGQGGQLEEEKEGQSEWEARGGVRKARGAERLMAFIA